MWLDKFIWICYMEESYGLILNLCWMKGAAITAVKRNSPVAAGPSSDLLILEPLVCGWRAGCVPRLVVSLLRDEMSTQCQLQVHKNHV